MRSLTISNGVSTIALAIALHARACRLNPAPGIDAGTYLTDGALKSKPLADAKLTEWKIVDEKGSKYTGFTEPLHCFICDGHVDITLVGNVVPI